MGGSKADTFNGFFESYLCQTEMDPHFGYTTTFTEKTSQKVD